MKGSSVLATATVAAAGFSGLAAADPRVVSMEFSKISSSSANKEFRSLRRPSKRSLGRRAAEETITSDGSLYFLNITVGSPAQAMGVYVDTGSSDLWLPSTASSAEFCDPSSALSSSDSGGCGALGGFDATKSSTFTQLKSMGEFQIEYGDGTKILGSYFTDNLNIGDIKLTNVTMALATDGETNYAINGIMGVGYNTNEAPTEQEQESGKLTPYQNVINAMKDQGAINTLAYSLFMNDLEAGKGTIIFGGIDKAKYTGNLVVVPVVPDPLYDSYTASGSDGGSSGGGSGSGSGVGNVKRVMSRQSSEEAPIDAFFVNLNKVSASNGTAYDLGESSVPVLLDSGTSAIYLPEQTAYDIYQDLGIGVDRTYGPLIRCKDVASKGDLSFTFGSQTIKVPINQIALAFTAENLQGSAAPTFSDGSDACQFGLFPSQNTYILGDTFVSSAYIVFDITNNQIGLAQSNFNATSSNIVEISSTIPADSTVTDEPTVTSSRASAAEAVTTRAVVAGGGRVTSEIPSSLIITAETTKGTLTAGTNAAAASTSSAGANNVFHGDAPRSGFAAAFVSVLATLMAWL